MAILYAALATWPEHRGRFLGFRSPSATKYMANVCLNTSEKATGQVHCRAFDPCDGDTSGRGAHGLKPHSIEVPTARTPMSAWVLHCNRRPRSAEFGRCPVAFDGRPRSARGRIRGNSAGRRGRSKETSQFGGECRAGSSDTCRADHFGERSPALTAPEPFMPFPRPCSFGDTSNAYNSVLRAGSQRYLLPFGAMRSAPCPMTVARTTNRRLPD